MWKASLAALVVVLLLGANRRAKPRRRRNRTLAKQRRLDRLDRLVEAIEHRDTKPDNAAPKPQPKPRPKPQPEPPPRPAARASSHGLRLRNGELEVADWSCWMAFATRQARRAVAEGAHRPEHVIARIFYAAFPDYEWPPPPDSPLVDTYDRLVDVAADNLDDELRPLRVADRPGLVLVD